MRDSDNAIFVGSLMRRSGKNKKGRNENQHTFQNFDDNMPTREISPNVLKQISRERDNGIFAFHTSLQ